MAEDVATQTNVLFVRIIQCIGVVDRGWLPQCVQEYYCALQAC